MPLNKKQDPSQPFDPLARTVLPPSEHARTRYVRGRRAYRLAQAKKMAAHFQLTPDGKVPESETSHTMGMVARDDRDDKLRDYPEMPLGELELLEDIIREYGLPLDRLHTDVAAFIFRRVMIDYRTFALLQRARRPPLFTPQELVELLRVLGLNQYQFSKLLTPGRTPQKAYSTYVMLQRWVQGENVPVGIMAQRVNALITQHVRRKGGLTTNARVTDESKLSQAPDTVRRRRGKRRQEEDERSGHVQAPLARAARRTPDAEA